MSNETQEKFSVNDQSFDDYFNEITKYWKDAGFTEDQLILVKILCESFEARGRKQSLKKLKQQ